jgi:hypothetical protein
MKQVVVLSIAFEVEASNHEEAETKAYESLRQQVALGGLDGFWVEDIQESNVVA